MLETPEMGKYGSDNVTENSCFAQKASMDDLIGINFQTFAAAVIPMDWGNRTYANSAAKNFSQLARLVGYVPLIFEDVSPEVVADLQAPHFTIRLQFCGITMGLSPHRQARFP